MTRNISKGTFLTGNKKDDLTCRQGLLKKSSSNQIVRADMRDGD